ncbi:MAG: hypothetical protein KJZ90_01110 [Rhodocyclaceae bacterium]|nr:hypothetical protein [Rhodocyclaceae bacterium]
MVTQERAREIWAYRSYSGVFLVTPEEDRFIREHTKTMGEDAIWADALLKIANGGVENLSLEGVGNTLVASCYHFISHPPEPFSADEEIELATALKDGPVDLPGFAQRLREKLVDILGEVAGADSTRYWQMIDAIGFWTGAHVGAWPYMTESGRRRYLAWALDLARRGRAPAVTEASPC